ncbi:MAG: branched-chain amino acid ABC transporter permease [Proteobacteria bacterium]|nr:branched-chain amino acid ABC transporter permease [Pseudomonadota bacterium]
MDIKPDISVPASWSANDHPRTGVNFYTVGGNHVSDIIFILAMNGLVWGLIIALIALGLSIIFGLLDIINVAHGDFFMLGTVFAWTIILITGNFWIAFLIVPLLGMAFGALIERVVIRPVENSASLSIVATFGLSLILQESVRATFGATPKRILDPIGLTIPVVGFDYEVYRLFAAGVSIAAIAAFFLFLHRTKFGTWMRAVRQDRDTAIAMGVPANRIFMVTFGLGTALAMFGGVVAAPITSVEFRLGLDVLPLCFMAVIIGGLGNLPGTAAAAVLLAFMEGIITSFTEPTTARIISLIFMSVVLLLRPQGIFARSTG